MNYVFFFADELRAEALSCYCNPYTQTPNFDKLAENSVLFEQCHVQHTVCSPSRCCLITGRYPHVDGHRTLWNLVKPHEKNLFSYLKQSGYEVRIYGKNDMFTAESVDLFTDEFISHKGCAKPSAPVSNFGEKGYYNFLYNEIDDDGTNMPDYKNVQAGIEFIRHRKPSDKPFILFLPLIYPHCPYTGSSEYYNMYLDKLEQIELRPEGENKPNFHDLIRKYRELNDGDAKKVNAVYSGMVSYSDMLLGKLMDCLKETNHDADTMLVVSSDHGDYAGDYGLVEKWASGCEDVLTRVPLLIKSPECKKGHRVKEVVELFDIMPTILESADIKVQHTHFAHSLMPQLKGESGDPNRVAFCEGGYNANEPHCSEGTEKPSVQWMMDPKNIYYPKFMQQKNEPYSVCRSVMARSLTHKLVRRTNGEHELYDLQKDPKEIVNVYGDKNYTEMQAHMEHVLMDWYLNTSDCVPFEEDARVTTDKIKTASN